MPPASHELDAADREAKRAARASWEADRAQLVFQHPLVASLALQLELVPVVDARLPTASTDGRAVYVNPYWLATLAPGERLFVLAHEVWHNALLHLRRQGSRDHARWNYAIDHEVNALLRREGFQMPRDAVFVEEWAGYGAERVYDLLEEREDLDRPPTADVHLGEQPVHDTAASGEAFGPIEGKCDPEYPGRADAGAGGEWASRVVALGPLLQGSLPGALAEVVRGLTDPRVPWHVLLRDFVSRATGGRLRWLPPSRRHVHRGIYLPSRREDVLTIAVALDTSGSTAPYWKQFSAELRSMLGAFGRYEVRLLQCDARVTHDQAYDDSTPLPSGIPFAGGGGTSFTPVFQRLAPKPPDALVFLTDGYGEAPREAPPYPVLWVLTPNGVRPARWGRAVSMD